MKTNQAKRRKKITWAFIGGTGVLLGWIGTLVLAAGMIALIRFIFFT